MGEDMKRDVRKEIRRVLEFLGFVGEKAVSEKKFECAIQASSMDRLRASNGVSSGQRFASDEFFGSREKTENTNEMVYTEEMWQIFEETGLLGARRRAGYGEEAIEEERRKTKEWRDPQTRPSRQKEEM